MDEITQQLLESIETDLHRHAVAHEQIAQAFTRIADAVEDANKLGGVWDRIARIIWTAEGRKR